MDILDRTRRQSTIALWVASLWLPPTFSLPWPVGVMMGAATLAALCVLVAHTANRKHERILAGWEEMLNNRYGAFREETRAADEE